MMITSQVYQVGGSIESHGSDAAIYLVRGNGESALIDAGTGRGHERVLKNIRDAGVDLKEITRLFITHCHYDHTGGARKLKEATGCSIIAHDLDAFFLESGDSHATAASWYGTYMEPLKIDVKIEAKQAEFTVGGIGLVMHHAPGHSPGSSVLTMVSDGMKVLFGQDVHGPLNEVLRSNRADYTASLEYLLTLEADILCEGHFGVFVGREKVRDFIESFI